jgi:hypothetical protein
MRKFILNAGIALLVAANANAAVPGSRITVTFENLVDRNHQGGLGIYDGLDWSYQNRILVTGKDYYKTDTGFQAVIRGKAAAVVLLGETGQVTTQSGFMTLKSGHFAALGGVPRQVAFNTYRKGVFVGTLFFDSMLPQDNYIVFNHKFRDIDELQILGAVAFDDLKIEFEP